MEQIIIDGVTLEGCTGISDRREDFDTFLEHTNGCGAGDAWIDFVPDTVYGLSITPICNLHDDAFVFCEPTEDAFHVVNKEFYENMRAWIKAKSSLRWRWRRLRYARAYVYYKLVEWRGFSSFCACKEALGEEVRDG